MAISQQLEKRTLAFGILVIIIFFILTLRLAYLQLVEGDKFYEKAEANRIKYETISAPRGKIYTTNGEILVTNKMAYAASVRDKALTSEENVSQIIDGLSRILNLDEMEIVESLLRNVEAGKIILIETLKENDKKIIAENLKELPGIIIKKDVNETGEIVKEYLQMDLSSVSTSNLLKAAKNLSELFDLDYKNLLVKIIANGSKDKGTIRIKRNLTQEEMVVLEENLQQLPGVIVERLSIREYINGLTLSHVLGYMGAIDVDELKQFKDQGYRGDDLIGKTGLERYYESYLRGKDGQEQIEVDSLERKIRTLGISEPLPGANIFVNIDLKLQKKVEQLLEETINRLRSEAINNPDLKGGPKGGAVIVMNPQNGKILALASNPGYDPNLFVAGITKEDYNRLINDHRKPFENRALNVAPPGSIFKVVAASAFLEEKVVDENTIIVDENGRYTIKEWKFDNWARSSRGGYGELTVIDAIAYSNNIYFYKVAHQLYNEGKGGITLPYYARAFGLGKLTGVDLPYENTGFVPDREWKREKYGTIWLPGESLHLSIGQGALTTSPLQLIRYISAIGNGGKLYRPYVVDRIESYDGMLIKKFEPEVMATLPISKKNLDLIKKGMVGVTTYGTAAKAFADLPITVAGKTGTAQTSSDYANHGWFAGFAPAEKPEIAILVFIEQGVSSGNTLPIVREILRYYFNIPEPQNEELESETLPDVEPPEAIINETGTDIEEVDDSEPGFVEKLKKFYKETFSSPEL